MGLLRYVLAACVVAGHSTPILSIPLLDAGLAVRTFFVISGFYMALILTTKYRATQGEYWLFLSNRFLRIYPTYLAVLALCVAFYTAASWKLQAPVDRIRYWYEAWQLGLYPEIGLITASQFAIFGIDLSYAFHFSPTEGFALAGPATQNFTPAWRLNFIPHAWSVSVELCFYLIAPFICALRVGWTWLIIGVVFAAHGAAYFVFSPEWYNYLRYFFAPFQLCYLLLGCAAFRVVLPWLKQKSISALATRSIMALFWAGILCGGLLPSIVAELLVVGMAVVAVPLLFEASKRNSTDRFIGDLSYPLYLIHVFAKWMILAALGVSAKNEVVVPGWQVLALATFMAVGLTLLIDYPIDRWRQARAQQAALVPAV